MLIGEFTDSTIVSALEPVDIFDSFISGSRYNFKDLAKDLESFGNQGTTAAEFLPNFESSGRPFLAAQRLFQESTQGQGKLFFTTRDGTKVQLYSPSRYEQGSSVSHVAISNSNTENFLMIPALSPGITLEAVMSRVGARSVYGSEIQKVLETVGWPTPSSPTVKQIQLSLGFAGVEKGSANKVGVLGSVLFVFVVSVLLQ